MIIKKLGLTKILHRKLHDFEYTKIFFFNYKQQNKQKQKIIFDVNLRKKQLFER